MSEGETLAEIAHRYSTPVSSDLDRESDMSAPPEPGDLLVIPAGYRASELRSRTKATALVKSIAADSPSPGCRGCTTSPANAAVVQDREPYAPNIAPPRIRLAVSSLRAAKKSSDWLLPSEENELF